ncbi:MAG: HlyD family secretion protein [Hyphomonadaceae bacterium]
MALTTVKKDAGASPSAPETSPKTEQSSPSPAAPAGGKSGLRKKVLIGVGALAGIAALWFGGEWFFNSRFNIATDNAQIRTDITRLTSKVQGYVVDVPVADNQHVKAGDLLVSLEASDFEVRVAQAKAALAQAEAEAAQANANISAERDELAEAHAKREAADASADLSASDVKRFSELADKGWYPKARVEQAEAAKRTANAQLTQAEASITAQRSQLTSTQAAAQSAIARVEAARAQLAGAELDLGRTQIRAPVDGVVTNKSVVEGQLLSPGQAALAIVQPDMWVIANFKETQIAEMKVGQCANIHIDAYPDMHITGKVISLAPNTGATFSLMPQDTATGNFTKIVQRVPVKIAIDKDSLASGLLRSGMNVDATVSTKASCE